MGEPTISTPEVAKRELKNVVCPKCGTPFKLAWQEYGDDPVTIIAWGWRSGAICDVSIECPHCDYKEEL